MLPAQTIESLRKPFSLAFVLLWIAAALFTVPAGLGRFWYEVMESVGYGLLIVAALGRMWCTIYIGGRKNAELCREGPYGACRNPLYFFSFLGVLGACLGLQSPLLLVVSAIVYLIYYAGMIRAEERRLSAMFGAQFIDYEAAVPRFWPRWVKIRDDRERMIGVRHLLRGLGEVFWFLAAIILIDAIEAAHLAGLWSARVLPL